jgi:ATPase subunit of ABC transporter with duplicated ATPase domains
LISISLKINHLFGNYTFWYESSISKKTKKHNKIRKPEEKKQELEEFIRRLSANVAKSKQATRKKND